MNNKKLAKNLILSVGAQIISLLASFIVGLVVPKFISELQYSYWQVFLLYFGYVGVFHFGLLDGFILRYSQYDYENLDKPRLRSQFQFLLAITSIVFIIVTCFSCFALKGEYVLVGLLVSIGVIIQNIFTYTSYTFQMTNRIERYTVLVIAQRVLYGALIVAFLLFGLHDFYWFCLADLASALIASAAASSFNKGLYLGRGLSFKETMKEAWANVSSGAFLMVSNLSSMLIVGGAKMVILWRWNELVFGKLAFAFSVANLFLAFVTAISVVLFPSLKRMNEEEYPALFEKIRNMVTPVLFFVLLAYFPGCWILNKWLPNYAESLTYLGILLPLIVFSSKNNLLTNNYLKVYRKEKLMLVINMSSVALGIVLFLLGAYAFDSPEFILLGLIATIMFAAVASELVVRSIIQKQRVFPFIVEFFMTAIFIFAARYCSLWIGCAVYAGALLVYAALYYKTILGFFNNLLSKLRKN